jgi:hypothetical protein
VRRRTWIENTHHPRRREHTLGRLTPIEFEILQQAAHVALTPLPERVNQSRGKPNLPYRTSIRVATAPEWASVDLNH